MGFRALDTSTNGADGGPIHTSSDVLPVIFQAGINLTGIEQAGERVKLRFGSMTNYLWQLESIDRLSTGTWQAVGGPVNGQDFFLEIEDERPLVPARFYRIKGEPIVP